jgi:hypothetical protein
MSTAVPAPPATGPGGPLRNLQVAQKLFVSFGALCLLVIAVGATGLVQLQRSQQRLDDMDHANLQSTVLAFAIVLALVAGALLLAIVLTRPRSSPRWPAR